MKNNISRIMTRDFTLSRYEALCKALISSGYSSITVQEYLQEQAVEPFIILRHDVDRKPEDGGDGEGFFPRLIKNFEGTKLLS